MALRSYPDGTRPELEQDFGVELLTHSDAVGWVRERAARCLGDWGPEGFDVIRRALKG